MKKWTIAPDDVVQQVEHRLAFARPLPPEPFAEFLNLVVACLRAVGQTKMFVLLLDGMVADRMAEAMFTNFN